MHCGYGSNGWLLVMLNACHQENSWQSMGFENMKIHTGWVKYRISNDLITKELTALQA